MKRILNVWLLLAVAGALTALAAGVAVNRRIINIFPENEARRTESRPGVRGVEGGEEENVLERRNWFLEQRLYGSDDIPAAARQAAKAEADLVAPPLVENLASKSSKLSKLTNAVAVNQWTSIGPAPTTTKSNYGDESGRINWVAVHPTNRNIALLGTATGGVWRSINALDAAPTFAPVSDSQIDLAVGSIAFAASDPSIVYAAMGDQDNIYLGTGVLKSTDAGATWTRLASAGLPNDGKGFGLNIAVNANDPNTVYLARGRSGGLPRTYPDSVGTRGFYRTTDGGATWTQTLNGKVTSFAVKPDNQNVIYAAVLQSDQTGAAPKGIYKSVDAGQSFAPVMNAPELGVKDKDGNVVAEPADFRVAASPANAQKIYFYGGTENADSELIVITDNGTATTFTDNTVQLSQLDTGQFDYNTYLVADPFTAKQIYIGSRDIFRLNLDDSNKVLSTTNLTNAWFYNTTIKAWDYPANELKAHSDQQHLAFLGDSKTFLAANDGGITRTTDAGATLTKNLNASLSLTQIVGLTFNPSDPTRVYLGAQDNGSQRLVSGAQWAEYNGGDGGQTRLDPIDKTKVYGSYTQGNIFRHDNNATASEVAVHPSIKSDNTLKERVLFYPPIEVNGFDSALYLGTQSVKVCTNCHTVTPPDPATSTTATGNWTYPSNPNGLGTDLTRGGTDVLSAIAVQQVAYGDKQVIYTGSSKGAFQVSRDGAKTFTNLTDKLDAAVHPNGVPTKDPGRYISNIKIDPADANTAYITVSGFGTRHVFKYNKSVAADGTTTETVTALNFTVDTPTNDFLIDPKAATTFYIATDIGVFRSFNSGATWNQYNAGLPPVVVNRLEGAIVTTPSTATRILAGTYGRGVYQIDAAPTAAAVSLAGRVLTPAGKGLKGARVTITDQNGSQQTTLSAVRGSYRFDGVRAGETYIVKVISKRYRFAPQSVTVGGELDNFDFTAQ